MYCGEPNAQCQPSPSHHHFDGLDSNHPQSWELWKWQPGFTTLDDMAMERRHERPAFVSKKTWTSGIYTEKPVKIHEKTCIDPVVNIAMEHHQFQIGKSSNWMGRGFHSYFHMPVEGVPIVILGLSPAMVYRTGTRLQFCPMQRWKLQKIELLMSSDLMSAWFSLPGI